jgi:hypothetical protein
MSTSFSPLHELSAEAATPDGTTFGRVHGISRVEIWFTPGYYQYATNARVAAKLEQLGRLLWTARTKAYYAHKSEKLGRTIRGEGRPQTPAHERRREARNNIVARGRSGDGLVELESVGLFHWSATIAPGTVPRVDEAEFVRACGQAAEQLVEQHVIQMQRVWAQSYS